MIEAAEVTRYYGSVCAVDNLDFSIPQGRIIGLLGPNGAGKTTTMRMITGYLKPTSGSVRVGDLLVNENPVAVKKMIGYLPEAAPYYGDMMVFDYLRFVSRMQGISGDARILEVAPVCGIVEVLHRNFGELSRGYKQRVGLACTLIHDPEILILDEPTSGLDPNQIIEVRKLIKEIGNRKTVIVSTHILSEVEMLCDHVIIINQGKIVADSPTRELQARFGQKSSLRVQASGCSEKQLAKNLKGLQGVTNVAAHTEDDLTTALVSAREEDDLRPRIFDLAVKNGWTLYTLFQEKNSLEDVFRDLTKNTADDEGEAT